MAKSTHDEIEDLIDETWRRIEVSKQMVCRTTELVEKNGRLSDGYRPKNAVRLHAECMERALLLNQISDLSCVGKLLAAFRANRIAAAIYFDPDRGIEIRLERTDRHTLERLVIQVPLELI